MDKVGRFYYIGIDQQYRAKAKKTKEPGCLRTEGTTANDRNRKTADSATGVGGLLETVVDFGGIREVHGRLRRCFPRANVNRMQF